MNRFRHSYLKVRRQRGVLWLGVLALAGLFAACSSEADGDDGPTTPPEPDPVSVCEESCGESNAAGKDDYTAYRECLLCDACAHACGASAGCAQPVDNPPCASAGDDCATCTVSLCAGGQNKDTTFSGHCAAQGQACAQNIGCVAMNNCVVSCLANGGSGGGGGAGGGQGGGGGAGGS